MATAEDYAQGLLDDPAQEASATTYDAEKREINQDTDTVAGQLDTILADDSKYITRARTSGKQYAQSRGLLNTSMGAQATEAAAIDAAMPIAQQDADTYFRQGLENQAAGNTALSTNAQLETNVSTSNAANDAAARNQALQTMGSLESQRLADAAAMDRTKLTEAGSTERQGMADTAAFDRAKMSEDAATLRQTQSDEAALFRTNLSEMAATDRQNIIAMTDVQTNDARINAEIFMNNIEMAAEDRRSYSTAFNEMSRQNYVEVGDIAIDPDLSADEKNKLITAQNARYTADAQLLSDLFSIPLELQLPDTGDAFTGDTDTGTEDTTTDPGAIFVTQDEQDFEISPEPEPDTSSFLGGINTTYGDPD